MAQGQDMFVNKVLALSNEKQDTLPKSGEHPHKQIAPRSVNQIVEQVSHEMGTDLHDRRQISQDSGCKLLSLMVGERQECPEINEASESFSSSIHKVHSSPWHNHSPKEAIICYCIFMATEQTAPDRTEKNEERRRRIRSRDCYFG